MLSIVSDRVEARVPRRELLRIGSLALGGPSLASLLSAKTRAAESAAFKDSSVVLLFLMGSASQIETFDPKMEAPEEYRSVVGEVKTSIPGVTFGGVFPRMAQLAHRIAIVRSFAHHDSNHGTAPQVVTTGSNPTKAAIGPVFARLAGVTNRQTGMPNHVLLGGGKSNVVSTRVAYSGVLGSSYQAFSPEQGGEVLDNMRLSMPPERLLAGNHGADPSFGVRFSN